jgi:hypothetical protein
MFPHASHMRSLFSYAAAAATSCYHSLLLNPLLSRPHFLSFQSELVALPTLDEIVHYDQWARRWVAEAVDSGRYSPRVPVVASVAA